MDVSFVIPTYNEKGNIIDLINKINSVTNENNIINEIIIIDDGSTDGSINEIRNQQKLQQNIRLLIRNKRYGVGNAHIAGYNLAKYNLIIALDADLSHSPKVVPNFIQKIKSGNDLVIGSRYIRGGISDKNLYYQLISRIGCYYLSKMLKIKIKDFSSGYRAIKRNVWQNIRKNNYTNENMFLVECIYYAHLNRAKISEVPIHFKKRQRGKSKTNLIKESFKGLFFPFKMMLSRN